MTISPIITVSSTPGLAISTASPVLTYAAILGAMGIFVYDVYKLYYQAASNAQFANPIQYSIYDANGDIKGQQIVTPIGPTQYQPTMYVPMKDKGVVLDGQSGFNFNMLPGYIRFIFYAKRLANQEYIDQVGGINNFKETEQAKQISGFFDTKNEDE